MSIPFSGSFSRSAGVYSAIGKHFKLVNLKPVKRIVFKFDPFQPNVASIRESIFLFSSERASNTNPRCLIKTEIVDNCAPEVAVTLEEGNKVIFKTENLTLVDFLQEFNKVVLPLVPKDEEKVGKVAGKVAGKIAASKSGAKTPTKKK